MIKDKYIIGCDPYRRPKWGYRQLQKIGLYKNIGKDHASIQILKIHENGTVEHIK